MANKVKYGLKNVHYAKATIDPITRTASYATPKPIPGAVNLSMDPQGGVTKFRADNTDYWTGQSNNGYEGDLEIATIPDDFRKDIMNEVEDSNGVLIEDPDAKTQPFALLFQFEGDASNTRHVMYNCTASRSAVSGKTTDEEIEPETETLSLTAGSVYNADLGRNQVKGRCLQTEPPYDNWFTSVYQATAEATYVTLTFDTDGGSSIPAQTIRSGSAPTQPSNPTKAGYTFAGWYEEDTFTTLFDFDDPITSNTVAYAKFTA